MLHHECSAIRTNTRLVKTFPTHKIITILMVAFGVLPNRSTIVMNSLDQHILYIVESSKLVLILYPNTEVLCPSSD